MNNNMKKVLFTLALALTVVAAGAQDKKVVAAQKAVEKAVAATENPKSAAAPATWIKLGKAYINAYTAPTGNFMLGTSIMELEMIAQQNGQKLEQPVSETEVVLSGEHFTKLEYASFDAYVDGARRIVALVVTKPAVENPLENAALAYAKAAELDPANKKAKDINEGLATLNQKYSEQASNAYSLGDMAAASSYFMSAYKVMGQAPLNQVDSVSLYNSALTAYFGADYQAAKAAYQECLKIDYCGGEGEVYVKLADLARKEGDNDQCQNYLEEGFVKFPKSQAVLIELINFYSQSGESTDRLFVLLDEAKSTDTTGKFLYYYEYVEGNIRLQLGDEAGALEAYARSAEAKPDYEFAYIGVAQLYTKKADAIAEEINAITTDWDRYDRLMVEYKKALMESIPAYEKAYEVSADAQMKKDIASIIKQICFRVRGEGAEYQAKYEQYSALSED